MAVIGVVSAERIAQENRLDAEHYLGHDASIRQQQQNVERKRKELAGAERKLTAMRAGPLPEGVTIIRDDRKDGTEQAP